MGLLLPQLQVLNYLLDESKLVLKRKLNYRVTYHDPCYLGRYNLVVQPPRRLLERLGVQLAEMPRNSLTSFCCGAGGGRMWMEETAGTRINAGVWGTAAFPSVYSTDVHPAQFLPHSPGWMIGATGALVASALFAVFSPYVGLAAALLLLGLLAWGTTIGRCLHFAWRSDLNAIAATSQPSRMRHRAVIAWLHLIQPIARIYGRVRGVLSPPQQITPAHVMRSPWKSPLPSLRDAARSLLLLIGGGSERTF